MDRQRAIDYITLNEGYRTHVYVDTAGHPTVGVGFNLDRAGARQTIEALGISYDDLRAGQIDLTPVMVETLLNADLDSSTAFARSLFPNFDQWVSDRQIVIVDMIFNLGSTAFQGFQNLIAALSAGNWNDAAAEMMNSEWYQQVGARGVRNVAAMQSGSLQGKVLKEGKDNKEAKEVEKGKDGDKGKDFKEQPDKQKEAKEQPDKQKEAKEQSDKQKETKEQSDKQKEGKDQTDKNKEGKEKDDLKEAKENKETKELDKGKDASEKGKDSKEGKDAKEGKDTKEGKETKEGKDSSDKDKEGKEFDKGKDASDKGLDTM